MPSRSRSAQRTTGAQLGRLEAGLTLLARLAKAPVMGAHGLVFARYFYLNSNAVERG